jgi:predicted dehydrogenase
LIDILILGYSRIAQKRVIPALEKSALCSSISIATITGSGFKANSFKSVFNSYEDALNLFTGNTVYISLPNSLHDKYAIIAANLGFNVIIDKPAILNKETLSKLSEIQLKNKNLIAESVVFQYHPAWDYLRSQFSGNDNIKKAIGIFTIPKLPKSDFRMQKKYSGGVLADMSAYSLGIGRFLWNIDPKRVTTSGVKKKEGIVTEFMFLADYGLGRSTQGYYSLNAEYKNTISLYGNNCWGTLDRVFSLTDNIESRVYGMSYNKLWENTIKPHDSFLIFFDTIFKDIIDRNYQPWFELILDTYRDYCLLKKSVEKYND